MGKGFPTGTWEGVGWSHHLPFVHVHVRTGQSGLLHLSQATSTTADQG